VKGIFKAYAPRERERLEVMLWKRFLQKLGYGWEAIDEKLCFQKPKAEMIREMAGWLSHEETEEIRKAVFVFRTVHEGDWE
jgi:hypothetical protein